MKAQALLLASLSLTVTVLAAQTPSIESRWATIRQFESQPATFQRDTSLVRAYADFVPQLIKKEPPDSSFIYLEKAYKLAAKRDWKSGILLVLLRKASALNIANRHYEALGVGLSGLKLAEQQGDQYFQSTFHRSLGNNYDMLDNYDRAIPHYETCLRLSDQIPALQLTRAHALVELGDAYRHHRKRPEQAKQLIEQAITIYQAADSTALGYAYDYYGQALTDLRLFGEAEQSFARSRHYYRLSGKDYLLPELLLHEAELYLATKNYLKAKTKARECLLYSRQKGSIYGQRGSYRILYESNKAMGELSDALVSHEQFVILNDSINETNNNARFRAVQSDYILQNQQDKINQLTIRQQGQTQQLMLGGLALLLIFSGYVFYNNRQLHQKNRAITAAMLQGQTIERQRVAADLHDNLGSTLSALQWTLEAIDKTKLTKPEQDVYMTLSQQVGQAYNDVRLLSHNLLPDELVKQGLSAALKTLIDKLNRNTPIHFSITGTDNLPRLGSQTEFELYSVCLELLTNTLKHAHASKACIDISQTAHSLCLTVGDNGTGLTKQQTTGRGLQNVATRVKSLAGVWTTDSLPGKGTQNRIVVPLKIPARASSQI